MIDAQDFWVSKARRLALRRNAAAWFYLYLPVLAALSAAAAAVLLVLRLLDSETRALWVAWGGALALAAMGVALAVRRRPFTFSEALARLDEVARLHNRLVSAQAGIGPWPQPSSTTKDSTRWNWTRLLLPVMISALLLTAVSLVEPPRRHVNARPTEEPAAWTKVDSWLQTLEQAKIADPQSLQKLQQQLDDLRRQPPADWYDQNSLEAGDALRKEMEQGLQNMEAALQQGSDALTDAARQAGNIPPNELKALSDSMQQSLQGLQTGNLPANKDLLGQMRNFNPASLNRMTAEQMQALRDRMGQGLKTCSQCVAPRIRSGLAGDHGRGSRKGQGHGGPGGGGGTAPLDLDDEAENLHSKRAENASDEDMSRAMPGDVVAVTKGAHQVDKTAGAQAAGGALSSGGSGGDAVWRESLTPDEGHVLQRYFK